MLDHHCIFICNCIGRGNQKFYFYWVAFLAMLSSYGLISMYYAKMYHLDSYKLQHLIFNPVFLFIYTYSFPLRKIWSILFCPTLIKYESLYFFPKDINGFDIIEEYYDPWGIVDNLHILFSFKFLIFAIYMMQDYIRG